MLAQNFKSSADLGLTDKQFEALVKTLVLLETDRLSLVQLDDPIAGNDVNPKFAGLFNMGLWTAKNKCGTVACIGGTAELVGDLNSHELFFAAQNDTQLHKLFYCGGDSGDILSVTTQQAARALRSYLSTGEARWKEARA